MGGNMRVKSLYAYDIKNDIVDVNSKEILMQSNNIIYEKIKSHFKINQKILAYILIILQVKKMNIWNL